MMDQAFRSGIIHMDDALPHNPASISLPTSLCMARSPRIDLLVVQPTPFCNINCSYCYLPSRSNRETVGDATLHALFAKVFTSGWVGKRLDIVWHAGEPTVLPVAFYRHAMTIMDQYRPAGLPVTHNFQTNATLLRRRMVRPAAPAPGCEWASASTGRSG